MTGLKLGFLIIILLLSSFLCLLPIDTEATINDDYPSLTDGQVSVSINFSGSRVVDSHSLNATDYYFIHAEFSNLAEETKTILNVFHVVLVVDQNNYTDHVGLGTYGNQTVAGHGSSGFSSFWVPRAPGEYTIRTFLISGLDNPQILSPVATFHVMVKDKIDTLGEGESNDRLLVQSINLTDNSVHVIETFCVGSSYHDEVEATLHIGEHVSIAAVDAYFLGIEGGKAIFRLEASASWESDYCLI